MKISYLTVKNFKSFKDINIALDSLNVLIGPNASGKSNFVEIIRFIKDISKYGFENAVSMQGGIEFLRNVKIKSSKPLCFSIKYEDIESRFRFYRDADDIKLGVSSYEMLINFEIEFYQRGIGFRVKRDEIITKFRIVEVEEEKSGMVKEKTFLANGEIKIWKDGKKINHEINIPSDIKLFEDDQIFPSFIKGQQFSEKTLLLEIPFILIPFYMFLDLPEKLNIYDIDPKLSKKGVPMTGKMELEEDGSNLAIVLKNLISKKRSREKLFNLINDMLPFLTDVDIKKFEDKSLFLTIKEKFSGQTFMPGSLISDGTINIIALIIALYFERNSIIVIEEPERNIHPYLLSKLTDMFIDASKNKQIFVTTHNSEIVKNTKPENILLISRDNEGFSTICKPADMEVVKAFIKNEIGIHELFVDNLLENKNEC